VQRILSTFCQSKKVEICQSCFMKARYFFFFIMIPAVFMYQSCQKNTIEDLHNHSLLNKTLDQIRSEIAGEWQIKRTHSEGCGIVGCWSWDTTYANNNGDYVYFLPNDTVKQTGYSGFPVKIYEKAQIIKTKVYYGTNGFPYNVDSAYRFIMANGVYTWTMGEIKNDSLVLVDGLWIHYLFRR